MTARASEIGLFEIVQQVENPVRRHPESTDDLPVVWILLALERDSRFVDEPQALGDLLPLGIGHAKDSIAWRPFWIVEPAARVAVSMALSPGLGHSQSSLPVPGVRSDNPTLVRVVFVAMNRRQFVRAATAGAVALARFADRVEAASYDLIVRGGRVIDPSLRVDAIRDVAITGGRIAAVEADIKADAADTIDARGKIVVPGLLDIHTHAGRIKEGPALCLADGVTGFVDAGSQGADRIGDVLSVARSAPQPSRVLVNIGRLGILPGGDTMDLSRADVAAARDAIAKNRDILVGVKARLSREVAGANDFEVLRRAQEVVAPFNLPVMIHMGQTVSPLATLLPLLKPGDIVTHMFAPPPNAIIEENGRIDPEVLAARRRGVWFDVGHGRTGHLRWDIVDRVFQAGFWPDTFSTDWTVEGRTVQVIDFPNVLSKFLDFGMPLDQVIARATVNVSRVFDVFRDRGTLNVGAPADLALLELRQGSFEFVDNYKNIRTGRQRLFPVGTVLGGKRVAPAA
jgi:dihydroorotase